MPALRLMLVLVLVAAASAQYTPAAIKTNPTYIQSYNLPQKTQSQLLLQRDSQHQYNNINNNRQNLLLTPYTDSVSSPARFGGGTHLLHEATVAGSPGTVPFSSNRGGVRNHLRTVQLGAIAQLNNNRAGQQSSSSPTSYALSRAQFGGADPKVAILSQRSQNDGDGQYSFAYVTGTGISRQEAGHPVGVDSYAVRGSYSYTSPEGVLVSVNYIADENGFQVDSPNVPPLPEHARQQVLAAQEARRLGLVNHDGTSPHQTIVRSNFQNQVYPSTSFTSSNRNSLGLSSTNLKVNNNENRIFGIHSSSGQRALAHFGLSSANQPTQLGVTNQFGSRVHFGRQPVAGQTVLRQPVLGQPVFGQTVLRQPVLGQTVSRQPILGQTVLRQPVFGQTVSRQPIIGQTVLRQPVFGQTALGQIAFRQAQNNNQFNEARTNFAQERTFNVNTERVSQNNFDDRNTRLGHLIDNRFKQDSDEIRLRSLTGTQSVIDNFGQFDNDQFESGRLDNSRTGRTLINRFGRPSSRLRQQQLSGDLPTFQQQTASRLNIQQRGNRRHLLNQEDEEDQDDDSHNDLYHASKISSGASGKTPSHVLRS